MGKMDISTRSVTDADLIGNLYSLVKRAQHKRDSEGTERMGEVAIYCDTSGAFAVQLRRRDGSAVEFGRHGTLRAALEAAVGGRP